MSSLNNVVATSMFGDSIYQRLDDREDEESNIGSSRVYQDVHRQRSRIHQLGSARPRNIATSDDDSDDDVREPRTSVIFAPQVKSDKSADGGEDSDDVEPRSLLIDPQTSKSVNFGSRVFLNTRNNKKVLPELIPPQNRKLSNTPAFNLLDPHERALWKWANVEDLDLFLQQVYSYFLGNGIYCILLNRTLNMA